MPNYAFFSADIHVKCRITFLNLDKYAGVSIMILKLKLRRIFIFSCGTVTGICRGLQKRRETHMKRVGRFVIAALVIVFCLSFLGSVSFFAIHTHHHCTGESCSVCAVLVQCDQRLRIATAAGSTVLLLLFCTKAAAFLTSTRTCEASCETLVSLKVEMLN